jgi:homocysteine S-methyltransferase
VGPYGAVLNDGSEYTGDYGVPDVVLRLFHEPRLAVLDNAGADFLAVETIPALNEAAILAGLLQTVKTPAWISFCCRDDTSLSDGAAIADAAKLFADHPKVFAVGVNCTAPQHVEMLIAAIRGAAPQKQVIVYPNSGERYDGDEKTWDGDNSSAEFAELAVRWFAAGADYIGGCCRVGPQQIAALRDAFAPSGS